MRAARRGTVAPVPAFVSGYLVVWSAAGVPGWMAWRSLEAPLAAEASWALRLAAGTLVVAGLYQLTPLKAACLRHCRSPMGFFLQLRGDLAKTAVAVRAGAAHGSACLGCCWALMAVLVAVGTMHLGWMAGLAAVIFVEKTLARGPLFGRLLAGVLVAVGVLGLAEPSTVGALI